LIKQLLEKHLLFPRLDVEQQNALNELKGKLMKEMDDMQDSWKKILEEEHKEMEEKFSQREAEMKENELKEREEIVNNFKEGT
jgi:predicted Holliday junction resolvase-like endonuclease